ncbi:pancreatic lipase-related protein 2-like [Aethina tumida]|uniref:pancreatic lipase-related protein 2-like n=1 Tax=Aethina tumida TaxID=116153 RepID=UPI0021494992|nr:pancreatic lipase-related protein 2-like [Aethina tumida]
MSGLATSIGLALAATSAVIFVMSIANREKHTEPSSIGNKSNIYRDPNGPDVQFILFLRNSSPVNINIGDVDTLKATGFNFNESLKIITHGFLSSIAEEVFQINKDAYLDTGNANVFGMDWSVLCQVEYISAMKGVEIAGVALAKFVEWLVSFGVSIDKVHLIGHSLGAHVAGVAGSKILNGKIGRITGLDPAGPGFNDINGDLKLDPQDAQLVDVIHTYMKVLSLAQPLGHFDFYPNGGRFQPGCPDIYDIIHISESLICNHGRSFRLFAESIRNKKAFKSKKCASVDDALYSRCFEDSEVYMGQPETYTAYGLYYVKTAANYPYSI